MALEHFITELCAQLNIALPPMKKMVRYELKIGAHASVNLELLNDSETLIVYSYLFPADNEEVCRKLLEANEFGRITGNASLSICKEKGSFVLTERFNINSTQMQLFVQRIQEIAASIEKLQELWPQLHESHEVKQEDSFIIKP